MAISLIKYSLLPSMELTSTNDKITFINDEFSPNVLLSDAAEAITNGFMNVFGDDLTRGYCFFHVMKNVDEKRSLVKDKDVSNEVRSDVSTLQLARSSEEFNAAKEFDCIYGCC
jgi:hypothetical protein